MSEKKIEKFSDFEKILDFPQLTRTFLLIFLKDCCSALPTDEYINKLAEIQGVYQSSKVKWKSPSWFWGHPVGIVGYVSTLLLPF